MKYIRIYFKKRISANFGTRIFLNDAICSSKEFILGFLTCKNSEGIIFFNFFSAISFYILSDNWNEIDFSNADPTENFLLSETSSRS